MPFDKKNSHIHLTTALMALALVTSCDSNKDGNAPQLSMVSPAEDAIDVPRDADITASFNEDILSNSVDNGSVLLTLDTQPVTGSVSFDALTNTATFTPTDPLTILGNYTATVTNSIADTSGNSLATDHSWSFTVQEGQWGTAELIEFNDEDDAEHAQIGVDSSGNALAVWEQDDGTQQSAWSNRYTRGSGWGTPELIEFNDDEHAFEPHFAINGMGNGLAVWEQNDGTRDSIWSNSYTSGSGWGTPELIESDNTSYAEVPKIAINESGDALAVWSQRDGTDNIWSNRYISGSGWGTAELIESDNLGDADYHQIAVDASGNGLAVWRQSDGTRSNIWSNRYTSGSGWGTAELIETDNASYATSPQIAFDESGNALAVWSQSDGTRYNIWSNRYTIGSGWGTAELIETDNAGYTSDPRIAFDASGNALAIWSQNDGTRNNIWSNRYTSGSGWGTAELIESDDAGTAGDPQIAFDTLGNALAVWRQSDGTQRYIWSNRYTSGSGWSTAEQIEFDDIRNTNSPQIAVDASGNALAMWFQYDGARKNIWSTRFD